jgi:alanyl-tRNA synthetase
MAKERGLSIDEKRFNVLMQDQKQKGRDATKEKQAVVNLNINDLQNFDLLDESSEFTGYDELQSKSKIIGYKKEDGKELIILSKTPFYVEAGGQVDDLGDVVIHGEKLNVIDLAKIDNKTIHIIENESSLSLNTGTEIIAEVDVKRRWEIMRNHSATHFMHAAMRKILGTHVQQAGSYVGPDRLRFDFAHFAKLSESEITDIESLVNEKLLENIPLQHHRNIPFEKAKKMGALMFFGDKYGDKVNVVQFGDFTMEFCGGTHVKNSSQIGLFKIISESSIASGVRRIEAVTGFGIEKYLNQQLNNLREQDEKYQRLVDENKHLEKEIAAFKLQSKLGQLNSIISNPSNLKGINIYKGRVNAENMSEFMSLGEDLRNKIAHGIGTLISEIDGKASILTVVTDDLINEKKLNAGKIVGELAKLVAGKGGGRPHLATAGGKNTSKIEDVLLRNEEVINQFV